MAHMESARKMHAKWRIDLAIHSAVETARRRSQLDQFLSLLNVARSRSQMLCASTLDGRPGWISSTTYVRGLLALAGYSKSFLRVCDAWNPACGSRLTQFRSLADHLLSKQPLPPFMARVWLEKDCVPTFKHRVLFKHLGRGNRIQGADLPVRLDKKMAPHFYQAPGHLTVPQAIRWAQVRGLGGDKEFAKQVVESRLREFNRREDYWRRVLQFLVGEPSLDLKWVRPILDFLAARHFDGANIDAQRLDRRRLKQLIQTVRRWLECSPSNENGPALKWKPKKLNGFCTAQAEDGIWSVRYWTIRELTSSDELREEGRAMNHCVASYAEACVEGRTSVWSLASEGALERRRELTIEVVPDRRAIVTALGVCNADPKPSQRRIMELWAEKEGLEIRRWV